ncbi:translation initiation factor IF-1A [Candidatus Pacearchaeota archaeon CG10_big_fil_rev_8_21_14_0_10_32_42]|nr:MAG: translation initiation factor IF-1A [Candidatus Pacearchaeota archaeon CG10_big_fil_rev_8_21_14_0_10_32_42]
MRKEDPSSEEKVTRAPLPKGREVLGIIEQRYGGNKMKVKCLDGKERLGRVPGRLKRGLWLRPGDIIIIEPWELDNTKGEILLKYRGNQIDWLKKNGYLEKDEEEF